MFVLDKTVLGRVDYALLLTFVGFFIFIGNMGRVPAFSALLQKVIDGNEVITNFDNIPSTFTSDEVSYPSKVDNSAETTFPVIKDQGYINSCF